MQHSLQHSDPANAEGTSHTSVQACRALREAHLTGLVSDAMVATGGKGGILTSTNEPDDRATQ